LTVTNQISGISSGAAKVETATDAGNQWHHVGFLDHRTGYQKLKTNGLTYNPATGKLYAGIGSFGTITGNLTGNVTGNVTGNISGEVTADQLSVSGIATISGLTYPSSDGSEDQVLKTDGAGNLTFGSVVSAGSTIYAVSDSIIATEGQTSFTSSGYTNGFVDVYLNGVRLITGTDYTANSSPTVVLATGASAGDELEIVNYSNVSSEQVNLNNLSLANTLQVTGLTTISGLTYPSSDGTNGQVLTTNGSGELSFTTVSGGGGISNYVKYVGTGTPDINSAGYTEVSWIDTTPLFSNGTWSATSSHIVVPATGLYMVQVNFYTTSSLVRSNVGLKFAVNDVQQSEIAAHNYIRSSNGHNESSINMSTTLSLSASDQVSIYTAQLAAAGTVSLQGTSSTIAITQLA